MVDAPLLPPRPLRPDGAPRRVGVEIEFAGVDGREVAGLARQVYGGAIEEDDPYRYRVRGTSVGDLTVELDMSAAHAEKNAGDGLGHRVKQAVHQALGAVGSLVMPFEVVFPPLPVERLPEVDRLVAALREGGAEGTKSGILNAFGLHLNPEAAAFEAGYLVDHLKAFALLAPWLRAEIGVDVARRLSPFTRPYPAAYVRLLADPSYRPDLPRLVEDYLDVNSTRDRELDMLPLLAEVAGDKVLDRAKEAKVKPRPAFHYRLPDSNVDQPGWGVVADWNRWVAVERLAADPERLARAGRIYLDRFAGQECPEWVDELRRGIAA
jgi:Putative amidoligase enzyme